MRDARTTFLYDNLQEQLDCYRQLNDLEWDKQEALISNDNRRIDQIVSQEELIIRTSSQLEANRVQWAASFDPSETDIMNKCPEIICLREKLREKLAQLREVNQINSQLINSQLAYINFSVQSIAGDTKPMYGSPGTLNRAHRDGGVSRSFIDHNA